MGIPARVKRSLTEEEVAGLNLFWQNYVHYTKLIRKGRLKIELVLKHCTEARGLSICAPFSLVLGVIFAFRFEPEC